MSLEIIVHADDYGLSKETTVQILKACDSGALSSVSILPNAPDFDHAIQELKKRPHLRVAVHLNFLEGYPVSKSSEVDRIVNQKGNFCCSFLGLWLKFIFSNSSGKNNLKRQIKKEMRAQIQKVENCLGNKVPLNIDSHNHYHMIPFVFDLLLELAGEFNVQYIRIPQEKFFWCLVDGNSFRRYVSLNVIKHTLLNVLSRKYRSKLDEMSIRNPKYFVGVLFSGHMSESVVSAALKSIRGDFQKEGIIEILFHPGRAKKCELSEWMKGGNINHYYCSSWRDYEFNELAKLSFKRLIKDSKNSI